MFSVDLFTLIWLVILVCVVEYYILKWYYKRESYIWVDMETQSVRIRYTRNRPLNRLEEGVIISRLDPDELEFYDRLIDQKNQLLERKYYEIVKDLEREGY